MPRTKKNSRKQRKPRKAGGGMFDWLPWPFSSKPDNTSTPTNTTPTTPTGDNNTEVQGAEPVTGGGKGRKSRKNHKKSVKGKSKK